MLRIGTDGCTTSHGGIVKATQTTKKNHGIPMLQAGDGFQCPICKVWSTLVSGSSSLSFDGIKAALEGDTFTCGARLIAQQNNATVSAGGGNTSAIRKQEQQIEKDQFDEQILATTKDGMPIPNISYYIKTAEGEVYKGKTDSAGKTPRIFSKNPSQLEVFLGDDADEQIEKNS